MLYVDLASWDIALSNPPPTYFRALRSASVLRASVPTHRFNLKSLIEYLKEPIKVSHVRKKAQEKNAYCSLLITGDLRALRKLFPK